MKSSQKSRINIIIIMIRILSAVCLVFIGCCVNVLVLEELTNNLNGVGNLITFFQFCCVTILGFIHTTNFGTKKSPIPLINCLILVVLFFVSSVCNNYAYNCNVPNTLHIIIKSGSLVTNMLVGILIGKRQYSKSKHAGVILITIGIIICTLSSVNNLNISPSHTSTDIIWWSIGIFLLIFALLVGAIMGLVQENLYKKFGKHPHDLLYWTHLLPLPLFIVLYGDIMSAVRLCFDKQYLTIPIFHYDISIWLLLLTNALTQYVCIRSVYILSSECTSLTVNVLITLRKFLSLVLSIIIFNNAFTISHWVGTLCVFVGTSLYLDIIKMS